LLVWGGHSCPPELSCKQAFEGKVTLDPLRSDSPQALADKSVRPTQPTNYGAYLSQLEFQRYGYYKAANL